MEIVETKMDNVSVLKLKGRLDAASAKSLKARVDGLAKENRIHLVVDMEDVEFIDSSGLGSLVSSLRAVNKLDGDVRVSGLQKQVRSIFELTRLHRIFGIFDDVAAAVKNFQ